MFCYTKKKEKNETNIIEEHLKFLYLLNKAHSRPNYLGSEQPMNFRHPSATAFVGLDRPGDVALS